MLTENFPHPLDQTNLKKYLKVAIKSLTKKYYSWSECMTLGELRSLQSLSKHQNIVKVYEVIREKDCRLHFVFEYMPDGNLYDLIQHFNI